MYKTILFFFVLLSVQNLLAQADTSVVSEMENVVVTGQYKPQSVKNSVYQVRVINSQQIRQQAPSKLQDVLNNQLNIRFSQDLATGGSDMTMLGLGGQNVKILIDGVPMIGRQGTSNEININQIEVNSIERIEIVEGPMSVVYGADALAGVINIITKKPRAEKFSVNARVHEESAGKEYGWKEGTHNQYVGASYNYKNWYASASMGRNLFHGWKDTAVGRELIWHKKDQIVANGTIGYRAGKLNVYYRIDGLDEIISNPTNPVGTQPAIDADYLTKRLMHQVQGSYNFNQHVSANALASYTHFTRQVYSTLVYPDGDVRVAPNVAGLHSFSTFNGFTFRGSVVYRLSSFISFQPGADINIETGDGERIKVGEQRINDYAFFVTSEISPGSKINIRPGLRFVHNSVYDAPPVIPSINTRFSILPDVDLRLAYARGFRSPSLRELYYDFFDASHSIMGNPDLQAEHSNSFTGSVDWSALKKQQLKLSVVLSAFYNDVDNMIAYATKPDDATVTTYSNIDHFKSRGASVTGNLHFRKLQAAAGVGYTGRYNDLAESDKQLPHFVWSPEVNGNISYSFDRIGLNASLYYKYTGRLQDYQSATINGQPGIQLVTVSGYHWADFSLNKKLLKVLTINAGIRNLFDVTTLNSSAVATGSAHSNSGYRPIGAGRSFFAGLAFSFERMK